MTEEQPTQGKYDTSAIELADVPDDVKAAERTGYAVYDRILRQYVGPVHRDGKPSAADAAQLAGHEHVAIVAV